MPDYSQSAIVELFVGASLVPDAQNRLLEQFKLVDELDDRPVGFIGEKRGHSAARRTLQAALDYFESSGQTALAVQVREDLLFYQQHAAPQGPWAAAPLGENRYRFTNTSGGKLAQITLAPHGATRVRVEDSVDPHTVPAPVDAGDSFVAVVRGSGMRFTATAMPSMTYVYSDFAPA